LPAALALTVTAEFAAVGCSPDRQQAGNGGAKRPHPNVLLVVMDTTRADRLGCYGSTRGLTPGIDALAASGVRFEHAYAHAPWTLPSTASLLTSRLPSAHGAGGRIGRFTPLSPRVATLAEQFRSGGYRTAAIINVMFLSERFGLTRGFEHVDYFKGATNEHMRPAGDTTDAAIAWLTAHRDRPFFALVHYFDPHLVYAPPRAFRERYADPRDRAPAAPLFGKRRDMVKLRQGKINVDQLPIDRLQKLYNAEVAYVDHELTRLIGGLKTAGLSDNTIVVLTADHGEEFLDHGGYEHGHTLYDELIHVPLIFTGRDVPANVAAPDVVGLMDVAPTLLHLAGLPPCSSFHGRLLTPAFEGVTLADRAVLSEGNMWRTSWFALRQGPLKLITIPSRERTRALLFDMAADPSESNDIAARDRALTRRLVSDLEVMLKAASSTTATQPLDLSDAERDRLCALGYVACTP